MGISEYNPNYGQHYLCTYEYNTSQENFKFGNNVRKNVPNDILFCFTVWSSKHGHNSIALTLDGQCNTETVYMNVFNNNNFGNISSKSAMYVVK